jgi:hypothetical protein
MTTEEYKAVESLLERFFAGETSREEEEWLYGFFAERGDIPEEWMPYHPVLAYFREGMACECATPQSAFPTRGSRRRLAWTAAIALVAIALAGHLYLRRETPFDPYEGSYVIQGGARITDIDLIRPELEAASQRVREEQEEIERLLASAREAERQERQIMEEMNRILRAE